jgi:hypothetical protein
MATVSFTDAGGVVEVSNLKAVPANRFTNWTPDALPIGPSKAGLGTGVIHAFTFREDYLVSFQIVGIPASELDKLLRLQTHLLDGYLVALDSDHEMNEVFALCSLAPNTEPSIEFSDATNLEYTFSCKLKAVDAEDVITEGDDAEPFYPPGECVPGGEELSGLQEYGDDFALWPLGVESYEARQDGAVGASAARAAVSPALTDQYGDVYQDDTEDPQRTAIVCTNVNGGHYALRATKTDADPTTNGYESHYGCYITGMPIDGPRTLGQENPGEFGFDDLWARMRFRFSNGFNVDDQGDGDRQDFIWLGSVDGSANTPVTEFKCHTVIGGDLGAGLFGAAYPLLQYPLTGDLEVFHSIGSVFPSTIERFNRETIVSAANIFDGNAHELVVHSKNIGTGWQVRYWYGDAFADDLTLVYDHTIDYDGVIVDYDCATFFPIEVNNLVSGPTVGTSQWHELHEWEYVDGRVHANPYGVP